MNEEEYIRKKLTETLHSQEPSPELMRSLRGVAHRQAPKRLFLNPRWGYGVAAVAIAGAAAMTLLPSRASAKSYEGLLRAANQVNAFQFTLKTGESSDKTTITVAGADGKFAIRSNDGAIIQFDSDSLRFYNPEANVVARFRLYGFVDAEHIVKQAQSSMADALDKLDLKKLLTDYRAKYGADHISISPVTNNAYDVNFASPDSPEKVAVHVNASTDLPSNIVISVKGADGNWRQSSTIDLQFGPEVAANSVPATFPADAKQMNIGVNDLIVGGKKAFDAVAPLIRKFDPNIGSKLSGALGGK